MPSVSQMWQKASGFFSSSGLKLKEAGQTAGTFVKDAKVNVSDVAERVGSVFKSRWALLQQPSTKHAVQERLITAAAITGTLVRKGITETKDKVSVGKIKVEEVAKKTAQISKTILTDIERWQKGVVSSDGLNSQCLFNAEGDKKVVLQLGSLYNQDPNASLFEGINPLDVATLVKCYLASLPIPLTTLELYDEIRDARSSKHTMRNVLKKLPLLLRVSEKSLLNKMDPHSLAMEMAPMIMWRRGQKPESYRQYWSRPSRSPSKKNSDLAHASEWDFLSYEGEDSNASSSIPLDDGTQIDFGAVEVIQCLIEHHNAIFTDANETLWK